MPGFGRLGDSFGEMWSDKKIENETPANGYVTEDSSEFYVTEDGTTYYVQE